MSLRFCIDVVLFISIFFLPWWVPFILALICLLFIESFYEIVVLGVVIDSLYNAPVARFHNIQFLVTFLALIAVLIAAFIKNRLRFYTSR